VVFANDERTAGRNNIEAAENAGFTRLRPVLMTALAMIIGMLPMALALGEGGEQNAPLGRAVIGGLLFATMGTLFVVPIMYSWLRKDPPKNWAAEIEQTEREEAEEKQKAAQANSQAAQGAGGAQPQTA
jgi:Cu/Ag efflux pump CusA